MSERLPSAALRRVVARGRRPAVPVREAGWVGATLGDVVHTRGEDASAMQLGAQDGQPPAARTQHSSELDVESVAERPSLASTVEATISASPGDPAPVVSWTDPSPPAPSTVRLTSATPAPETKAAPEMRRSGPSVIAESASAAATGPSTTRVIAERIANTEVAAEADAAPAPASIFARHRTARPDDPETASDTVTAPSTARQTPAGSSTAVPDRGWQALDRAVALRPGLLSIDRADSTEPSSAPPETAAPAVQGEPRALPHVPETGSNVAGRVRRLSSSAAPAAVPASPQIFIDRIEVVSTPAAVEPDPFGSLASLRRGIARPASGGR